MVDIMTALATAGQAIKLANDLRGIDKAMDAAEFKLKIADLTVALSDIKIALADAKEELSSKQSEIDALKKKFARIEDTIEYQGYKYAKGPEDSREEPPSVPFASRRRG
jgi:predicted  nucleic acid-binding Zn-ribbon protein